MSDNLSVFINPPWPPPFLHQPSHLWSWWWKPTPTPWYHQRQRQSLTSALLCNFAKSDDQYIRGKYDLWNAHPWCLSPVPLLLWFSLDSTTVHCHQTVHKIIIFSAHHNTSASLCLCKRFCICGQAGWLVVIRQLCQTSTFWTIIPFKGLFPRLEFLTPLIPVTPFEE